MAPVDPSSLDVHPRDGAVGVAAVLAGLLAVMAIYLLTISPGSGIGGHITSETSDPPLAERAVVSGHL